MGKVLRVLVVVILVLSAISLFFATELFKKRELLTRRNSAFEEQFIKLAKTLEAADAQEAEAPVVAKDTSEVSDRLLDNPEKVNVFENYPIKLEQQNLPTMDLGSTDKRRQLRSYFALGPDGKPVPDPVDNKPSAKGPGTMQELLDNVLTRATAQQATLNRTRGELTKVREQVAESVAEINNLKTSGRTVKVELTSTKEKVVALTDEKTTLEGRIVKLNSEKKELSAELADAKDAADTLRESEAALNEQLAKVTEDYKELQKKFGAAGGINGEKGFGTQVATAPTAGDKGKIIEANDELKFAIIELSDDAIAELLGPERQNALPQLEMNVRRIGRQSAAGEFVTRIKLRQAVRGKNFIVADILNDWQQTPVEKGDVVFF